MKEETSQLLKKSNEGIKFLCLLIGIIGIILLIISVFTTPILIIISIVLCIIGIVFSAIYKSIAGLVVNILGIAIIPIAIIISTILISLSTYGRAKNTVNDIRNMLNSNEFNNYNNNYYDDNNSDELDEFYEYFNSKTPKLIYYTSSTCGYCSLETPIIEQIAKDYDIDYLTIDSTKLTKSDKDQILRKLDIENATPTTVVVKKGKVLGTQVGYLDGVDMVEFLKENNVLNNNAEYTTEKYLTFINYNQYNEILEQNGKHIITIGQTGCSHCTAVKPTLNSIAKDHNIVINYLNITEMTQSEMNSLINSLKEIGYDDEDFVSTGSFGTPLTFVIENGKVITYVIGERPLVQFINAFKKAGIIAE